MLSRLSTLTSTTSSLSNMFDYLLDQIQMVLH